MTLRDDGFASALQQQPDNDTLRLVYADFLEERGNPADAAHAELIRVQIELASAWPAGPRAEALTERQDRLAADWECDWLGDWADVLDGWTFRRGLLEAVRVDTSTFLDCGGDLLADWPTLAVAQLTRAGGHLRELADSPWLAHLRGLDLSDNGIDAEELADLTRSRFIPLLEALDLSGNPLGPATGRHLAAAWWADELRELHLRGCRLGGYGLEGLLGGRRGRQWRRLDLSGNDLRGRDLAPLTASGRLQGVRALDLGSNPLSDGGVAPLADAPAAAGLVALGLADTDAGDASVAELTGSPHLSSLRALDLRGHRCRYLPGDDREDHGGIGILSRSPMLGRLDRLLLGPAGPSNGWAAEVLGFARPTRPRPVFWGGVAASVLRKSRYLVPSRLVECDLEELWWLGDRANRERLPIPMFAY